MLALLLCVSARAQDTASKQQAAESKATQWLTLVDNGNYEQSWQQASSFFKSKVTQAAWSTALKQVRTPLGAASKRTLLSATYQTDLPGMPKGEYVIFQYKAEFPGKGTFVETITPMLDTDGTWRVSGYFIKPAQ
jgi:hypothetical protein